MNSRKKAQKAKKWLHKKSTKVMKRISILFFALFAPFRGYSFIVEFLTLSCGDSP